MMLWLLACDAPDAVRASDPAPAAPPVVIVGAGVAGLATVGLEPLTGAPRMFTVDGGGPALA